MEGWECLGRRENGFGEEVEEFLRRRVGLVTEGFVLSLGVQKSLGINLEFDNGEAFAEGGRKSRKEL